jgi:hypothetical protein
VIIALPTHHTFCKDVKTINFWRHFFLGKKKEKEHGVLKMLSFTRQNNAFTE